MHTPESASPSKRARLCRALLKALLFLWGTLIVTTGVGTLANYFNDTVEQNESVRSVFAHLVIGRLLLSHPVPIAIVGTLLLLVTGLSWLGSREPSAPASSGHQITTQDRQRLLQRLHVRYTQLRDQSLQDAVEIELGLASRPAALANATSLAYRFPAQPDQLLPPQTTIVDVYTQAQEELLILGEPGAGKSTLLLQLASHLLTQSEQDENQPIPALLPLSTWAIKRPLLQDWISDEFARLYDIPKRLSTQWIEAEVILPLLDGLDEMAEHARPACIAAINTYHRDHLHPLVVCSRTNEYEHATTSEQLTLHAAVIVQPLSSTQVNEYLVELGKPLAALRSALKKNEALATLATTPLMLQILMLIYQGTTVRQLSQKKEELEQQIWVTYVQQMIARKGKRKKERKGKHKREVPYYSDGQTVSWLRWLARSMRDHNQTIFALEYIQPDVLPSKRLSLYSLSVGLFVWLLGVLLAELGAGLFGGLLVGLFGGLLVGLFGGLEKIIEPAGKFDISDISWKRLPLWLLVVLLGWLLGWLIGWLIGWQLSGQPGGLGEGQFSELLEWLLEWPLGALLGALLEALFAVLQHYVLRLLLWHARCFPLKAVPFLEDATTRILLRRVGGSYSFTHRRLLDYFADLDPSSPPSSKP